MSLEKSLGLEEGEHIIAVVRSFFVTQLWLYAAAAIVFCGTVFGTFWFISQGVLGYFGFGFGLLLSVLLFIKSWSYNRTNYVVVTNERVMDVVHSSLWKNTVSGVRYHAINDVVVDRTGLGATLFNHGTLTIITDDESGSIELEQVRFPHRLQQLVLERKEVAQESSKERALPDLFTSFLQALPRFNEIQLILLEKKIQDRLKVVDNIDSTLF